MRTVLHVLGLTLLFAGVGCMHPERTKGLIGPMEARLTGVVQESSTSPGHYALADGRRTRIKGTPLHGEIEVGALLETEQYLRLKLSRWVEHKDYNYQLVFGPTPDTSETAFGRVLNQEPSFYLGSGWALFWGLYPMGYTNYTEWGVDHSSVLTQTVDETMDRVYLLEGSNLEVRCRGYLSIPPKTISTVPAGSKGMYIEITRDGAGSGCSMTDPRPVNNPADGPDVEEFVGKVTRIAKEGEWPGIPGVWPEP